MHFNRSQTDPACAHRPSCWRACGAVLMVVFGVLSLDQAFSAIDLHTLLLLLGTMIITVYLRIAGFLELMADKILSLSKTPLQHLMFITPSSGLLSALFVNDTICLLYTPIILAITEQIRVNPMPYLLALATSSNIGSVMTVTGNPQNMLIGIYSRVPYLSFLGALVPVAALGLAVSVLVISFVYRKEMQADAISSRPSMPAYEARKPLFIKTLILCAGVLVGFALGYSYSLVAATGAVALILIGGVRTESILEGMDWTLLLFFSGLFIAMRGIESSGIAAVMIKSGGDLTLFSPPGRNAGLSAVSAVLSNVVSNVPPVMLLKPLTQSLGDSRTAWLTLAMSSTLAGNLTLIGSVANLIVVQQARRTVEIRFMEYLRVGALITMITISIGILTLAVEVKYAHGGEAFAAEKKASPTMVVITRDDHAFLRTYRIVLFCNTNDTRVKGLQGFRRLKPNEVALFVYPKPEAVTFWMGSVDYPIDIIFVGPDKKVLRVYPDCQPGSLEYYPSFSPAQWVVETAAGSGIRVGDGIKLK
ncbi:MAG TPA: SLC13 family permease [Nitrospirota bacterium]|nr:SLC13 family permease [Nitrospirota bacterium]